MYIVQLSDLHFPEEAVKEKDRYSKITDSLIMTVKDAVPPRQQLLITVCGDLVNQGLQAGLENAKEVLNRIRSALSSYEIQFGFVPGNHDLVNGDLTDFNEFISNYCKDQECFEASSCYCIPIEEMGVETNIIFVNSVYRGDMEKGEINYSELSGLLERLDSTTSKIMVLHHTIMSMDNSDKSSIINAAYLVELIEKHNISLLLHGHTHGLDAISIGSANCAIVGVGAFFSRNYPDVNSQFNLIQYQNGTIDLIRNYTHHQDRSNAPKKMQATDLSVPNKMDTNTFGGSKISDAYNKLMTSLTSQKRLYNVSLHGNYLFNDFKRDVDHSFGYKRDFDFNYASLAESWQSNECPPELYFSHGQYYYNQETDKAGVSYIIETLKKKPTSSRAVLSTISMKEIDGEEDYLLPSLMVIQFGFDRQNSDTLIVTMYLRALEASRFLKINICEILYLAKKVYEQLRFDYISVTINAFRVQVLEDFSCFVKSELDKLATDDVKKRDIQEYVRNMNYEKIISLLEGKYKHIETVVVSQGIEELIESIKWVNSQSTLNHYDASILDSMIKISDALEKIKEERKSTSIYDELDESKENVRLRIKEAIDIFSKHFEGDAR